MSLAFSLVETSGCRNEVGAVFSELPTTAAQQRHVRRSADGQRRMSLQA